MSNVVPFRRSPSPPPPAWGEEAVPELSAAARLLAIAEEIERMDPKSLPGASGLNRHD